VGAAASSRMRSAWEAPGDIRRRDGTGSGARSRGTRGESASRLRPTGRGALPAPTLASRTGPSRWEKRTQEPDRGGKAAPGAALSPRLAAQLASLQHLRGPPWPGIPFLPVRGGPGRMDAGGTAVRSRTGCSPGFLLRGRCTARSRLDEPDARGTPKIRLRHQKPQSPPQ